MPEIKVSYNNVLQRRAFSFRRVVQGIAKGHLTKSLNEKPKFLCICNFVRLCIRKNKNLNHKQAKYNKL